MKYAKLIALVVAIGVLGSSSAFAMEKIRAPQKPRNQVELSMLKAKKQKQLHDIASWQKPKKEKLQLASSKKKRLINRQAA